MKYFTSAKIAMLFGITFVATGVLGFVPNPLVSASGLFEVNAMHNLVHLITGAIFIAAAKASESASRITLQSIGIAYVVVTVLGFLIEGQMLLGMIHINEADKWLHAGLALIILVAGFALPKSVEARSS